MPKNLNFTVIDVETANADMSSICQIGIVQFINGSIEKEWSSLINPEDYFDFVNVNIHGITENDVADAPLFIDIENQIRMLLEGGVCISHTHFDRVSLERVCNKYKKSPINTIWLDSARVTRRAWEQCAWSGYGLAQVTELIGYEFKHHDALEDAKAAGQVLLAACDKTGLDIDGWLKRVNQPIDPEFSTVGASIAREGNPDGALYGETMVFTGALCIPRSDAANLAAKIGCNVAQNITKKTTMLVVGDQDISKLAGKTKSSKHIKAEALINKGHNLRIIKESDFMQLLIQS